MIVPAPLRAACGAGGATIPKTLRRCPVILRHAFIPPDNTRLAHLCGGLDENLHAIEATLDVRISRRNESFRIEGTGQHAQQAVMLLQSLYGRARRPISPEKLQL